MQLPNIPQRLLSGALKRFKMVFGYAFIDLTEEQKVERRHYLDLYASIAQASAIVILVLLQLRFLAAWAAARWAPAHDAEMPSSPFLKARAQKKHSLGFLRNLSHRAGRVQWWMGDEVIARGWGTRGEWIGGALWTTWLLFLCIHRTGEGRR